MIAAFLLGLTGSFGHCVGMCSGIALLLSRRGVSGRRLALVHFGRITTYAFFGAIAGSLGRVVPGVRPFQGTLSLLTAVLAGYMALAMVGRARSPELLLGRLTRKWGLAMQQVSRKPNFPAGSNYLLGLLWGLLPCGLVMAAWLTAAASGSVAGGMLAMLAFGLGTLPVLFGVNLVSSGTEKRFSVRTRGLARAAAVWVVSLFGMQMALRGLAAWGWVNHLHLAGVMIW